MPVRAFTILGHYFFLDKHLDHPQYTRPLDFEGLKVPDILRSGNHKKILSWRKKQSLLNTYKKRKDLLSEWQSEMMLKGKGYEQSTFHLNK